MFELHYTDKLPSPRIRARRGTYCADYALVAYCKRTKRAWYELAVDPKQSLLTWDYLSTFPL